MLSQKLRVEGELHEYMHLRGLLADDQLAVVSGWKLIQSEETQIGEDLVKDGIVAVRGASVLLEENSCENL